MADIASVAKRAGVSRATAARAFSSPEMVREQTREKVMAAARELRFRPNTVARQLRSQATRMIGVMVPSLDNPVFAEQLQAMEVAARERGFSLLVTTSEYDPARESEIVESMLRQRVDGLVLTVADAEQSPLLAFLRRESTPCLLVYNPAGSSGFPSVGVDNRAASETATRHLIELGHTRIGMVAGPLLQSDRARQRFEGYCQAMQSAGLTPRALVEMPRHTRAELAPIKSQLEGSHALTALIATNDLLAISLIGELTRAGFKVPEDVSIMGFDGIALGKRLYPSLCTIEQPRADIGREAVNALLALLEGEQHAPPLLPYTLRDGESVAPPVKSTAHCPTQRGSHHA